jgi:hypothetical protein
MKLDQNRIFTTDRGYVIGFSCTKNHSGNTGLVHHSGDLYECQGCLNYYTAEVILRNAISPKQASKISNF